MQSHGAASSSRARGRTWVEGDFARSSVTAWVRLAPRPTFDYIADMTRHPEWANDALTVERVDDDGGVGVGTRYRAVGHQAGKAWPADLTVTGYEPPTRFEFTATGGPIGTTADKLHRHEFVLTPQDGGTLVEIRRADPLLGWTMRLVGRPLVRATLGMRVRTLARLAARLNELAASQAG